MLVILFRLLSLLPLRILHALGTTLGWLVYFASPTYRNRLKDNIGRAGMSGSLHAAVGEAGKSIMELPFIWCAAPERVLKTVTLKNWEVVQEVIDAKHGALFLTPHLGCFEIIPQYIATLTPVIVMYRPPRKKALLPLVEGARARENLGLAPANLSGVRMMLKFLKRGGLVGLLPDQVPQQGEGVWAEFFGKPAYTMTLPGKLQQMTGAPVILTYAERLPRGEGYAIHFHRFDAVPDGTPESQARAISEGMERLIADCPSQYFWSYNRYKTPDGVEAPPL